MQIVGFKNKQTKKGHSQDIFLPTPPSRTENTKIFSPDTMREMNKDKEAHFRFQLLKPSVAHSVIM